ncbi:MAG: acetoacetate decarboxylase family protein [Solirubrobacteraceae bacterium]
MRGSPFFDGVAQVNTVWAGVHGKLPIFYYDGSGMTALFPARLGKLKDLLPDPRLQPARLAPGVGVVAVSAFRYADTDIGPYNELAISIALRDPPWQSNLPGRSLRHALRTGQYHAYIHQLPVTTEVAVEDGRTLFHFPKFLAPIAFHEEPETWSCRLVEDGEAILTLRGARIPTPHRRRLQLFSHLWMDGQPQSAEFKLSVLELGLCYRPGAATLELGQTHPIARELAAALLSTRAVHYQLMGQFEAILYGPDHLTLPLLERARSAIVPAEQMIA